MDELFSRGGGGAFCAAVPVAFENDLGRSLSSSLCDGDLTLVVVAVVVVILSSLFSRRMSTADPRLGGGAGRCRIDECAEVIDGGEVAPLRSPRSLVVPFPPAAPPAIDRVRDDGGASRSRFDDSLDSLVVSRAARRESVRS